MVQFINKFIYRLRNRNLYYLLLLDSFIISFSFFCSLFFRYDFSIPPLIIAEMSAPNIFIGIMIKLFSFRIFGLYRGLWRYTSVWDMFNLVKANILGSIVLTFTLVIFNTFDIISRSFVAIDFILCTGLISISRLGIRLFFSHIKDLLEGNNRIINNILIIGAGDTGQSIFRQLLQKSDSNSRVVAFVDDNPKKIDQRLHGVPVYGPISSLESFKINFDEIYICAPSASKNQIRYIVDECRKTNKPFKTLPSISELIQGRATVSQFREVSILDLLGRQEVSLDKSSIKNFIKGKRVLITGAGGSIGSELVRQCLKFKPSVLMMVDCSELNLFEIEREVIAVNPNILIKPHLSDIRDLSAVEPIFDEFRPQIVFHAAAYKHVPMQEKFPSEAIKTNVFGTINLSELSIKYNVEKFVLVSTDKAVRPTNVMGATKRLAEIVIQNSNQNEVNTEFMAVRFGNVLGSSGSVIPIFKEQIKKGGPVTVTDPDMERYFMSIPEASQLILQAGGLGNGGEVFILDMGKTVKIIDLASELIRLSGYEPGNDIPIEITGTRPGEKKIEELSLPTENLDNTKHSKIFVLKNSVSNNASLELPQYLEKLRSEISTLNPSQIKSILSSILKDYKPEIKMSDGFFKPKTPKTEA